MTKTWYWLCQVLMHGLARSFTPILSYHIMSYHGTTVLTVMRWIEVQHLASSSESRVDQDGSIPIGSWIGSGFVARTRPLLHATGHFVRPRLCLLLSLLLRLDLSLRCRKLDGAATSAATERTCHPPSSRSACAPSSLPLPGPRDTSDGFHPCYPASLDLQGTASCRTFSGLLSVRLHPVLHAIRNMRLEHTTGRSIVQCTAGQGKACFDRPSR